MRALALGLICCVGLAILSGSSALRPEAHGSIFNNGVVVTCTVQSTYYEIPTWTVSTEAGIDAQTDGDIVLTVGGTYLINATCSFDGDNGEEYHYCLFMDGVEVDACEAVNTAKAGSGRSAMAAHVVTACAAGCTLDMRVADVSGGGAFGVDEAQFSAVRIGP
jgi:hypothetical protein